MASVVRRKRRLAAAVSGLETVRMFSIENLRAQLGSIAHELSDAEVEEIGVHCTALADLLFDLWLVERKDGQSDSPEMVGVS